MLRAFSTRLSSLFLLASSVAGQTLQNPAEAVDYNPSPRVVETVLFPMYQEVQLTNGQKTRMMVYNGTFPGPTIHAEVGDTLIVHFVNLLNEPTILHWHGIEMPAVMDGSQLSQAPIPQYGYFRYQFKLSTAGTFWYHPHLKNNEQIEKGLYGALVVHDKRHDRRLKIPRSREKVIFLDDIKLDGNNQIAPFSTDPNATFIPWARAEDQANARPGTNTLVNSMERTDTNIPTLEVLAGAAYRLRFINPSNGEVFRLDLTDPNQRMYAVGSDQGLWNAAERVRPIDKIVNPLGHHNNLISNTDLRLGVTLTPSDRMEVVLCPEGKVGTEFFIRFHDMVKGVHVAYRDPQNKLLFGHDHNDGAEDPVDGIRIKIVGTQAGTPWKPPARLRYDPVRPIVPDLTRPSLPVVFGHAFPHIVTGDTIFFANVDRPFPLIADVRAKKMTMPPGFGPKPMMMLTAQDGYHVKAGETHYYEIVNFTGGDHNFHTHGFHFQHIDTEFIDLDTPSFNFKRSALRLSNEDTLLIPKRPGLILGRSFTIVRVAVRFDDSDKRPGLRRTADELLAGGLQPTATTSGGWLVHCHHLEHAAKGMATFVTITR